MSRWKPGHLLERRGAVAPGVPLPPFGRLCQSRGEIMISLALRVQAHAIGRVAHIINHRRGHLALPRPDDHRAADVCSLSRARRRSVARKRFLRRCQRRKVREPLRLYASFARCSESRLAVYC
jgi:hypothetical protein